MKFRFVIVYCFFFCSFLVFLFFFFVYIYLFVYLFVRFYLAFVRNKDTDSTHHIRLLRFARILFFIHLTTTRITTTTAIECNSREKQFRFTLRHSFFIHFHFNFWLYFVVSSSLVMRTIRITPQINSLEFLNQYGSR